jgi:hypothetical protein
MNAVSSAGPIKVWKRAPSVQLATVEAGTSQVGPVSGVALTPKNLQFFCSPCGAGLAGCVALPAFRQ